MKRVWRFAVALGAAANLAAPVAARPASDSPRCPFAEPLGSSVAAAAASDGHRSAVEQGSFFVKPWVLYAAPDALRAEHARPGIDAVIVETPYERVRYESFLQTLQGTPLRGSQLTRLRETASREFGFIVYAHSRDSDDRDFLGRAGHASVEIDGRSLPPSAIERFGPASDFYSVGDFRELRWTGSVTYRFAIEPMCARVGTLQFSDGYGTLHTYRFDLGKFK